eukprot:CAMPEP_0113556368 /NCGR_PEP_ID=MMETSP0015_2-20120614/17220_1 /TAXON_ID=2838 /ORGANISM="Odontella" /LENGTH=424 /DNA_ID=CAMNT_0000457721 /DNA_START=74 /DNA_END=1348 /DNA_ORIENTATION=+ /assembly_acc=CAM_ASM_000160
MSTTTTTSNESTVYNDDGSKTIVTTKTTKFPDGMVKIVKNTRKIPPTVAVVLPSSARGSNSSDVVRNARTTSPSFGGYKISSAYSSSPSHDTENDRKSLASSAGGAPPSSSHGANPSSDFQNNRESPPFGVTNPSSSSGVPATDTVVGKTVIPVTRSIMRAEMSNNIGTEEHDDTFSVPVEWPRGQQGNAEGQNDPALQHLEGGLSSEGDKPLSSDSGKELDTYSGDDGDSSDEGSFHDENDTSPAVTKTVKWKLAILFLSSIYELISIITKTQLALAINELEACRRCNHEKEDLIEALYIPSLIFSTLMIIKEGWKVVAAFLTVCCDTSIMCGDETVWPRNPVTIPIYFMKSTLILPSHQDDYEYEYSQSHTLLNLCVEDLPFFVIGIYGVQLNIKSVGFGVFISFIGVIFGLVEAIRYVRKS